MNLTNKQLSHLLLPTIVGTMLLAAPDAAAVQALRTPRTVVQPDGSELTIHKIGDEHFHLVLTDDNVLLAQTSNGYQYARLNQQGYPEATGLMARRAELRNPEDVSKLTRLEDGGESLLREAPGRFTSSFPATGDANVLVILVEYQDVKFTLSNPFSYFNGMLNEEGFSQYGGTGCAKEYFKLNSSDLFRPHFDVYGPVTLPNEMAYYGGNDSRGNDKKPHEMVSHAAELLDDEIDFSKYDMDGDGYVDNIYVIYAGQGEASFGSADTVWPHSGDLISSWTFERHDGKTLNHYACSNEWLYNAPDGIGTFIHEFSHVIGLPDLYATDGSRSNATPGNWSVLDYGPYNNNGCTPPNYSVFERNAMGWIEPIELGDASNLTLREIGNNNEAAIIRIPGTENEFFLLENRQQIGWDKYLPGHGMLVWHVDYQTSAFEANVVNNNPDHQRVDIIEAGNKRDVFSNSTMASYPWPGTMGMTELGFNTVPQLATWAGADTGVEISDIEETPDGRIKCRINGGIYTLDTPSGLTAVAQKHNFVADWTAVDGAEAYELEVTARFEGEAGEDVNDMGNGSKLTLPEGWTAGSTKVYTTSGNYGASAPSYKMETDQDWILSPEYGSDVNSLSFWMKGTQTSGSMLDVYGLRGGEWVNIGSYEPLNNKVQIVTVEVPAGIRQIKFVYTMVKGRVAIDDIKVSYGTPDYVLAGYSPAIVEAPGLVVDCGGSEAIRYTWRVRAVKGEDKSRWSDVDEILVEESGVSCVNSSTTLRLVGKALISDENKEISVYDTTGRLVARAKGEVSLTAAGLYLATDGDGVVKIVLR